MQIRPARLADATACAGLTALSMGTFGDALLGLGDPARQQRVLEALFRSQDTRFSYPFIEVAEVDGQVLGLLLSFPGRLLMQLNVRMGRHLLPLYGLWDALRLAVKSIPMMTETEAKADEYYVSNLAVARQAWGQGLGRALLARAEEKALEAGLYACSLTVEIDNERALALYQRVGYQIVHTQRTPQLEHTMGTAGHHRMVKQLGQK